MSTPPRASIAWTRWKPLHPTASITPAVLAEILDGDQAFRWWPRENGGADIDADFQGWCDDADDTFGPGGRLNGRYHLVYLSTVVRMVPVMR